MPRAKNDVTRVNVYLPDSHLGALKLLAAKRGNTYSQLVRDAVRLYLDTERERLLAERAKRGLRSNNAA